MGKITLIELQKLVYSYVKDYHYDLEADKLYKREDGKTVEADCTKEPYATIRQHFKIYMQFMQQHKYKFKIADQEVIIPEKKVPNIDWKKDEEYVNWLILSYDSVENSNLLAQRIQNEHEDLMKVLNPKERIDMKMSTFEFIRMLKIADSLKLDGDEETSFLDEFKSFIEDNNVLERLRKKGDIFQNMPRRKKARIKTQIEIDKEHAEEYIKKLKIEGKDSEIGELKEKIELSPNENFQFTIGEENLGGKIALIKILLRRKGIEVEE